MPDEEATASPTGIRAASSAADGRRAAGRHLAAVAALFLALAIVFTWPLATRPGSLMTAQPFGDPLLNAWSLAGGADRLPRGLSQFWTGLFYYPYRDTLAYSEHLLGITVFTAPVQWVSGNPILAFNLALIGSGVLAGVGTYLLARELTGRTDAALLAGVAFACSPYRVPQIYHLQVLMAGWIPVGMWALHRFFATGSRRALAGFTACFVLQAYSNGYFLYFMSIPVAIVSVHGLWRARGARWRQATALALSALAILAALAPIAAVYLRVKREQGLSRSLGSIVEFAPDIRAYGHISDRLWLWSGVLPVGRPEHELFPGLAIMLLTVVSLLAAARTSRSREAPSDRRLASITRLYAVILLAALVLSLGPSPSLFGWRLPLTGPYGWWMAVMPGLDGLRVPARLAVIVLVALAVLGAAGFAALTRRLGARGRWTAAAVAGAFIAAEGYAGPLAVERFPTPGMATDRAAYEWLARQAKGPMLELPVGGTAISVRHLYQTLVHRNRTVNGYSGYGSPLQDFIGGPPFGELERLDDALTMARTLGIRWLMVHPPLYRDPEQGEALVRGLRSARAHVARLETLAGVAVAELRSLQPSPPRLDPTWQELPPAEFTLAASHNVERLPLLVDGDRATRWLTGVRQQGGEWVEIRFTAPRDVARVRLEMDRRSQGDYPRGLAVEVSLDGEAWTTLFGGGILPLLGPSFATRPAWPAIDIALPPNEARLVRLRTLGQTRVWFWSIHELRVWQRR
jgi:hypothetical protein